MKEICKNKTALKTERFFFYIVIYIIFYSINIKFLFIN